MFCCACRGLRVAVLFLVCLALSVATGCGGSNPSLKLIGTWKIDSSKINLGEGLEAQLLKPAIDAAKLEIRGDGTMEFSAPIVGSKKATWKYDRLDGVAMILKVKQDGATTESEVRIEVVDDDHIKAKGVGGVPNSVPGVAEGMPMVRVPSGK